MSTDDWTGLLIGGRYRVERRLGEGAMGVVYLALDEQLRRHVALKALRSDVFNTPEVARRLENECLLLARFAGHNHIVTLHDRIIHDGRTVLVLEYVPGQTLESLLRQQKGDKTSSHTTRLRTGEADEPLVFTDADIIPIALQCLEALDYAHSKGVLHRDVKPGNILVYRDQNGQLSSKMTDFGVAKAVTGPLDTPQGMTRFSTLGHGAPGTPAYMAPEQIDPEKFGAVGPQTDLYAMGVTLYEMATRRLPFEGTLSELLYGHTHIDPPDPVSIKKDINRQLQAILLKALRKEPTDRYQNASSFIADLRHAAGSGGTVHVGVVRGVSRQQGSQKKQIYPLRIAMFFWLISLLIIGIVAGVKFYPQILDALNAVKTDTQEIVADAPSNQVMSAPQSLPPPAQIPEKEETTPTVQNREAIVPAPAATSAVQPVIATVDAALESVNEARNAASEARSSGSTSDIRQYAQAEWNEAESLMKQAADTANASEIRINLYHEASAKYITAKSLAATRKQEAEAQQAQEAAKQAELERLAKEAAAKKAEEERRAATPKAGETRTFAGIEMVWIPAGTFTMGSPGSEANRSDDEKQHSVTISRGFWLGKYEVTQSQWESVMGSNPSYFKGNGNLPVEQVSWDDCQSFIRKLNGQGTGTFRLPTEAEWEYACRAGTTTPFHFGSTISTDQANYDGNYAYGNGKEGVYRQKTTAVGSFPSNAWGLYDMHGNVWEWCQDWYGDYPGGSVTDPPGPSSGSHRVYRGGSWLYNPRLCRSALRYWIIPEARSTDLGFRLALSPVQ